MPPRAPNPQFAQFMQHIRCAALPWERAVIGSGEFDGFENLTKTKKSCVLIYRMRAVIQVRQIATLIPRLT
jgi:hypothetical protein